MAKISLLTLLLIAGAALTAQNIYSALHMQENRDYKKARPKMIIETNIFYGASGESRERHVKSFDDAGMLISVQHFDKDNNLAGKATYINDTTHRIVLARTNERKEISRLIKSTTEYIYDSSHFLVQIREKNAFGLVTMVTHIVNNEKGLPVEMIVTDGNGRAYGKETASYHYDRNMAITAVYHNDGRKLSSDSMKISFEKAYLFPDGQTKYNEHGDVIGSEKYEYEYKYDQFDNCVEQKIYKVTTRANGKKKKVLDREFRKEYVY